MSNNKKKDLLTKILEKIQITESETVNFIVPKLLSQKAVALHSIREDLIFARNAVVLLHKIVETKTNSTSETEKIIETASLWYSMIAIYGRCFTDASNGSKTKLEVNDCFPESKKEFLITHSKLMDLRHNFIAHRGDTSNEQSVLVLMLPKKSRWEEPEYRIKSAKAYSPSNDDLEEYINLFDYLIEFVEDKIKKQVQKVHSKFLELDEEVLKKLII